MKNCHLPSPKVLKTMGLLVLVAFSGSRLLAGGAFLLVHPEGLLNGWELSADNNDPIQPNQADYYVNPADEPYAVNRIHYNPQVPEVDANLLQGEETGTNPRMLSLVDDDSNPFSGPMSYVTDIDAATTYLRAHGWEAILVKIGKGYPNLELESIHEDRLIFLGGLPETNPFPNDRSFSLMELTTNIPRCVLLRNNHAWEDAISPTPNTLINNDMQQVVATIPDNVPQKIAWLDEDDLGNTGQVSETVTDLGAEADGAAAAESYKQVEGNASAIVQMQVWPNPTHGQLQARIDGLDQETLIFQVLSIDGQVLSSHAGADGAATFDLSQLAAGTYYVRAVAGGGRSWSTPVILQR